MSFVMSGSTTPRTLDTLGVEIEVPGRTKNEIAGALGKALGFRVQIEERQGAGGGKGPVKALTHDASVESYRLSTNSGLLVYGGTRISKLLTGVNDSSVIGVEVVTNPMCASDMEDFLRVALPKLSAAGEFFSPRASIHVHVGFPTLLESLKCAVALGLRFESLVFAISGLGNPYRGAINHSIYARPMSLGVAVPVDDGATFYNMLPAKALEAKTMDQFWKVFLTPGGGPVQRYHPARYFALNVYSSLILGTIEFRTLNLCFDPEMVIAAVRMFKMMAEIAAYAPTHRLIMNEPDIPLTERLGLGDHRDSLRRLIRLAKDFHTDTVLTDADVETILGIINKTPPFVFDKQPVITHVKGFGISSRMLPSDPEIVTSAVPSGQMDIHNFQDKFTTMLPE